MKNLMEVWSASLSENNIYIFFFILLLWEFWEIFLDLISFFFLRLGLFGLLFRVIYVCVNMILIMGVEQGWKNLLRTKRARGNINDGGGKFWEKRAADSELSSANISSNYNFCLELSLSLLEFFFARLNFSCQI